MVANPPYMGSSNMNKWLTAWAKSKYKEVYRDLCTCFIKRGMSLAEDKGYEALITSDTCMYISSFERMRKMVIDRTTIVTFIDTRGTNAHPDVFDANAGWVLWNHHGENVLGAYFKLNHPIAEKGERLLEALADPDCGWFYRADADGFGAIPGSPIAYWASLATRKAYAKMPTVEDVARPHIGIQTGDNERFLRLWWEIALGRMYLDCPDARASQCSDKKWYPCNKGGDFRRWYGNQEYVVDWQNDGRIIVGDAEKDGRRFMNLPDNYKFCESVAWSMLSSSRAAFRFFPQGFIFEHAASAMIGSRSQLLQVLAFCNSEISRHLLSLVSPTLNFNVNCIAQLPMTISSSDHVERLSRENVYETKTDWNSFECSWDFKRHPLV